MSNTSFKKSSHIIFTVPKKKAITIHKKKTTLYHLIVHLIKE